jgi:hypothetical protein
MPISNDPGVSQPGEAVINANSEYSIKKESENKDIA